MLPLLLAACTTPDSGTPTTDLGPRGDCNPVQPEACALPFPSSFFLDPDDTSETGWRVAFGPTSLPVTKTGTQMDPTTWNRRDGFPILGPMLALLPGAVATSPGAATFDNLAASLDGTGTSLLVDTTTGTLVEHYLEREAFTDDVDRAALVLHPAVPLEHSHRYVVALHGLVDEDGAPVAAPTGFATLRDGGETDDPDLERQRESYEDVIFPAVEAQGWAREDLQLAWDFVTESEAGGLRDMTTLRERGFASIPEGGPPYSVTSYDHDCSGGGIGRVIEGTMTLPLFLTSADHGSTMVYDADDLPTQNGTAEVPFTVGISCSALADGQGALLLQGGHGLFGAHTDVLSNPWASVADAAHAVVFATSWRGLSGDDYMDIAEVMASDPSGFHMVTDQLEQGQFEALALARLMKGDLAADPVMQVDGHSVVDTGHMGYLGVSLGSVVGGAQVAMSPDVERAVMMIPGAPFSALLTRSNDFTAFLGLLMAKFDDPVDISLVIPLTQMLWQDSETGGWAHSLVDGAAMGGRDGRRFLFQVGIGDDTVTSIAGDSYARMVGAGLVEPAPREVFEVPTLDDPTTGSGLTEWDYGYTENPDPYPQGVDPNPHNVLPGEAAAVAQAAAFLTTGDLSNRCDGVCDPE